MGLPLLSLVTFLPLLGALFIFALRGEEALVARNARWIALWTSVIVFLLSLLIWADFDSSTADFQFVEKLNWIPGYNIAYLAGVDGISMFFVLLSTLLTPLCIVSAWEAVQKRVREYMIAFLVLETFMIGMFCALDIVTFYIFFEGVLIPMFLIIGVWGGQRRVYAAFKFFLYTLAGSVLMLLAILYLYFQSGSSAIPALMELQIPPNIQIWLWLAFFASFAVKVPMWPVHTWLPDAHVEAPTAGSVILAGVLLKMGAYGFLRFSIPILPDATAYFTPMMMVLSVVAIIYTSLVALAQEEMKKLIAYSSVAHMGFVTIGIFSMNQQGVQGAVLQMVSHGIVSGALFLCVGVIYDRMHTRLIDRYGGLVERMPKYALIFMLFTMANVGLPGTSGFIGEILTMVGIYEVSTWTALFAASGVIFSAVYALTLYRNVMFGEITNPAMKAITDVDKRELLIFAPLIIGTLWLGFQPGLVLDYTAASVEALTTTYRAAIGG